MAIDDLLDDEADDGSGEEEQAVDAAEGGEVGPCALARHGNLWWPSMRRHQASETPDLML